jgi:hypothetical protein
MGHIKALSAGHPVAEIFLVGYAFAYLVEGGCACVCVCVRVCVCACVRVCRMNGAGRSHGAVVSMRLLPKRGQARALWHEALPMYRLL